MRISSHFVCLIVVYSLVSSVIAGEKSEKVLIFHGASDASAAVSLNDDMFIVADDENNVLRVYRTGEVGAPVSSFNLTRFLGVDSEQPEADIEGATMIGSRIYWITSHGRNKEGKIRSSRYRFFATDIELDGRKVVIRPVGTPCETLALELVGSPSGRRLGLDKATRFDSADLKKKDREKLAPKEEGLNIEALCASPDGKTIYIGFRNPRPKAASSRRPQAIVVPLQNADKIVETGDTPVFGESVLWDLRGLGIRSMEYSEFYKACFIIAGGPGDDNAGFLLYRWSGSRDSEPVLLRKFNFNVSDFTPEALIPFSRSEQMLLLSDDGTLPIKVTGPEECARGQYRKDGTCQNKYLLDADRKTFRAVWLSL